MERVFMSAELLAPVLTGDGRSGLVVDCPDHAIPFGVILDEYKRRRPVELQKHAAAVFRVDGSLGTIVSTWKVDPLILC
jgi:hypothetical protein